MHGSLDVVDHGRAGVFLHDGDMLVGGGVENQVGTVLPHTVFQLAPVADAGDATGDGNLRIVFFHFFPYQPQGRFRVVQQHDPPGGKPAQLPDQLAADGAGGAVTITTLSLIPAEIVPSSMLISSRSIKSSICTSSTATPE